MVANWKQTFKIDEISYLLSSLGDTNVRLLDPFLPALLLADFAIIFFLKAINSFNKTQKM